MKIEIDVEPSDFLELCRFTRGSIGLSRTNMTKKAFYIETLNSVEKQVKEAVEKKNSKKPTYAEQYLPNRNRTTVKNVFEESNGR